MNIEEYKKLFTFIAKTDTGTNQNLEEIENRLTHLRKGAALSYEDLVTIADPKLWPFSRYWMWPHRDQIGKHLPTSKGWFKNLPIDEAKTVRNLDKIFRNIELVSILLRFAVPEEYAICSKPVLEILRIDRGRDDIEEYLYYVQEMRVLRDCLGVKKTAEADKIVWAISHSKDKYASDLKKILSKRLPGNLTAEDLLLYLSYDPIKVAKEYLKRRDHITAGFWAAKALEKLLDDECRQAGIFIPDPTHRRSATIKALTVGTHHWGKPENRRLLYNTKEIRNRIIPGVNPFTYSDVEEFILNIDELKRIALHRGY